VKEQRTNDNGQNRISRHRRMFGFVSPLTNNISGTPPLTQPSGTCGPFTTRVTDATTPGQFVERQFEIPIM